MTVPDAEVEAEAESKDDLEGYAEGEGFDDFDGYAEGKVEGFADLTG